MNYFITHCDKNYIKYAERLFETLKRYSECKIIFLSIDFDYENRFDNVINIKCEISKLAGERGNDLLSSLNGDTKSYHVFLKPLLIKKLIEDEFVEVKPEDNFCYLDSDCFVMRNCDDIFNKISDITYYPLFTVGCQEYMMLGDRGNPFANKSFDLKLTLEAPLMELLKIDVNLRTSTYSQTGAFIFNSKCYDFIKEWFNTCFFKIPFEDMAFLAPFHEETVANCLLWKNKVNKNLGRSLINVIEGKHQDLLKMVDSINNPQSNLIRLTNYCTVPGESEIEDLYFYHRRVESDVYEFLTSKDAEIKSRKNYYITHCDENLISTVEKLFDSAQLNSKFKIIFFTINFSYESTKYKNVIPVRLDIDFDYNDKQDPDYKRRNMLLMKPKVCLEALKINAANYCYLDADNILLQNSDDIFKDAKKISKYPLLGLNCHEYMINEKFGNPFKNGPFDLSLCLEARALKELNIPLEKRTPIYRQSNVFLFNYKCKDLINLWQDTCQKMMNSKALEYTFYDETVLNCLLWGEDNNEHLNSLTINLPIHENMEKFSLAFKNPPDETYVHARFCKIFNYNDINNIKFFHGYVNADQYKFLKQNVLTKSKNNRKIIFLAPHLSTGGSPAYLKWLIEKKLLENYSVKVIEYCFYGADYVVQRNQIIDLVGEKNFLSFGCIHDSYEKYEQETSSLIDYINQEDPSEIHLNEISEEFSAKPLTDKIKKFLYSSRRRFKIFETCHNSTFNFENKVLLPDEFHFCSPFHLKASENLNVPKKIVEMEIPKKLRPERSEALKKLGLSPDYFHVLNVGLFMVNKNQKYLFALAEKLKHKKIKFHFIGNTCFLNDCGIPRDLLELHNCVIHGEKDNVDEYMAAMDLFAFPSLLELNPIALKEALSWGMDVYLNKLDVYADYFDNNELVTYIEGDNLFNYLNSIEQICQNIEDRNEFKHSIENIFGKIEILGPDSFQYLVRFFDDKEEISFEDKITNGMWSRGIIGNHGKVEVTNLSTNKKTIFYFEKEKDSDVNVVNESGALGDCLGWTPVVNQYALDINKKINFYTPHKHLFNESKYPLINFIDYSSKNQIKQNEKTIKIGCFDKKNISTPLQKLVADILQVDEKNIIDKKPFLNELYISDRPFEKKYVCIATQSTAQLKYWNNPEGWDQTVDYLKNLGYEVVCIDRYSHYGNGEKVNIIPENALHYPGKSMADIINCLHHCEFMIGLSSGLSWLAWACKKPVIMICGFLEPEYHFETPYYIQNTEVCNNCWHNPKHTFDAGNWMWCPENKDFECSKMISFDQVKENIDKCISDMS